MRALLVEDVRMLTLFCLIAVVVLLAVHEFLLVSRRSTRFSSSALRRALLLALVVSAIAFGARAQIAARVQSVVNDWRADPVPFEMSGDPFLREALAAQRPERPFPEQGSPEDVSAWQREVAATLRSRSGLPQDPPAGVPFRVLETADLGDVRRTFLEFPSWDGTRIPAYVHQPKGRADMAAVLVVPGHGAGIRATAGVGPEDYQHAVALELARRGYVTLTPELRGFGLLAPGETPGLQAHIAVAHAALEAGSFYKAVVARDLQLALTVLQEWEGVDPARLAVAGTSLGGELAVFLAGLDSRLRVVVSHSYGGGVGTTSLPAPSGDRQPPHGCHTVPGINRLLLREDWFRLLAPRALQIVRGREDVSERATALEAATKDAYRRLGAPERFELALEPGGHEFFIERAAGFLATWL